ESDFNASRLIGPVNGLPAKNRYHQGFINDVELQGSGIANDGTTIHYDGGNSFSVRNCPLTATGACAVDGTTIAVDFGVVPRRSTVSIDGDGNRVAQDTGGAINGYHIDEYFGTRRSDCVSAGQRTLGVDFVSY
ncbi:TPA: 3D domain-containing protein, partial [Klebsiella pneumoniae]